MIHRNCISCKKEELSSSTITSLPCYRYTYMKYGDARRYVVLFAIYLSDCHYKSLHCRRCMMILSIYSLPLWFWTNSNIIKISDFPADILSKLCLTTCPWEWKIGDSWLVIRLLFKPKTRDFFLGSNSASIGTFSCRDGFHLEGKDRVGCNLFGQWESEAPLCKRIKY